MANNIFLYGQRFVGRAITHVKSLPVGCEFQLNVICVLHVEIKDCRHRDVQNITLLGKS